MSQIAANLGANAPNQSSGASNAINELGTDAFLDLMIAELQNQDPLNPLENDELLAQISQIREVGATEKLTETLNSVLLGQNIASATNLIGADVVALSDTGERVSGNVRKVTLDNGEPKLDLALDTGISAGENPGALEPGGYLYEIAWDGADGTTFSVEVPAVTASIQGFDGSIQVNNLPDSDTQRRIYRTDRTGDGERQLVGTMRPGATSFTDSVADSERGSVLQGERQQISFAAKRTVTLNNISEITPPN